MFPCNKAVNLITQPCLREGRDKKDMCILPHLQFPQGRMWYFSCTHSQYPELYFLFRSVYSFLRWDWSINELDLWAEENQKSLIQHLSIGSCFSKPAMSLPFIYPALQSNIVQSPFDSSESRLSLMSHISQVASFRSALNNRTPNHTYQHENKKCLLFWITFTLAFTCLKLWRILPE